jgi:hypothetical protein
MQDLKYTYPVSPIERADDLTKGFRNRPDVQSQQGGGGRPPLQQQGMMGGPPGARPGGGGGPPIQYK